MLLKDVSVRLHTFCFREFFNLKWGGGKKNEVKEEEEEERGGASWSKDLEEKRQDWGTGNGR